VADPSASSRPAPSGAASSLAGKRIVITRAALQSSELFEKLLERSAIPASLPLVSFSAPQDYAPLDAALRRWQEFDWVLFTSANAVESVVSRSAATNISVQQMDNRPRIAAVGPATNEEATRAGLLVDHVAKTHLGVALAEELASELQSSCSGRSSDRPSQNAAKEGINAKQHQREKSVFLPRSDRANPDLPAALRRLGANVTEVVAYRTLPPANVDRDHATKIIAREADAALFFSPSAVNNLAELIGKVSLVGLQNKMIFAAVGPVTAAALREQGIERIITAADTTAQSIIEALESHFAKHSAHKPIAGAKHG
jgi:uroporphyrinogen-III synthase